MTTVTYTLNGIGMTNFKTTSYREAKALQDRGARMTTTYEPIATDKRTPLDEKRIASYGFK